MESKNKFLEHHFYIIGIVSVITALIILGMGIWFFVDFSKFNTKYFKPDSDEKKIGITYGFEDSVYVFIPIMMISMFIYLITGLILITGDVKVNHKSLVISMSIVPAVLGVILLLNSGISFQNNQTIDKNFSDTSKQSAVINLRDKKIPYTTVAVTSLIIAIVEILVMIGILVYYFYFTKNRPPSQSRYMSPKNEKVYVPENYLLNDGNYADPNSF